MQVFFTIVLFVVALIIADLLFGDGRITQQALQAISDFFR
jgi:hypothetical protein